MRTHQTPPSPEGENRPAQPRYNASRRKPKESFGKRFVRNWIPNKNDSMRDLIRKSVLILMVIVLISSIVYIASYFGESRRNRNRSADLAGLFSSAMEDGSYEVTDDYPKGYLKKFFALWEINDDIAGWINIPDTQLNYAVVQADDNAFYDRTDFDRKDNQHGIPFVDYRVDLKKPSTNTIIYSHNMNDGQMFGELINYKSLAYYKEHPLITFDSVYGEGKYKITAIIVCKADDPDFLYHNFINDGNAGMTTEQFIEKVRERSLLHTTVDMKPTDKFLTLSTCDYSFRDPVTNQRIARFVVVARKVRSGEEETVDVASAKINANPVMPAEWSAYILKQQEAELKQQEEAMASQDFSSLWEEAKTYFTSAELSALTNETIEVELGRRKTLFQGYLSPEEISSLTVEQKLALLKERQETESLFDIARDAINDNPDLYWMSESEIDAFAKELAKVSKDQWPALMKKKAKAADVDLWLDQSTVTLRVGDEVQLTASTEGGDNSDVKWDTEDHRVAVVNPDGTVVGRNKGKTTVIATYSGRTASCTVTVLGEDEEQTSIRLDPSGTINVAAGSTVIVFADVRPDAVAERGLRWKATRSGGAVDISPNDDTLSCEITGIQANKTVEITVTAKDGTAVTFKVYVKEATKDESSSSKDESSSSSSSSKDESSSSSSSSKDESSSSSNSSKDESSSSSSSSKDESSSSGTSDSSSKDDSSSSSDNSGSSEDSNSGGENSGGESSGPSGSEGGASEEGGGSSQGGENNSSEAPPPEPSEATPSNEPPTPPAA